MPGIRRDGAVPGPPELAGRARRPRQQGQGRHRDRRPRLHGERRERDEPERLPTTGPATCPGLGRIYVFSGEDITGPPARRSSPRFDGSVPRPGDRRPAAPLGRVPRADRRRGIVRVRRGDVRPANSSCLAATPQIGPSGTAGRLSRFPRLGAGPVHGDVTGAGKTFVVEGRPHCSSPRSARPIRSRIPASGRPPATSPRPGTSAPRRFPTSTSRRPARISPPAPTRAAAMR